MSSNTTIYKNTDQWRLDLINNPPRASLEYSIEEWKHIVCNELFSPDTSAPPDKQCCIDGGRSVSTTKIPCRHCGREITKQNMSRHLYACTNGKEGTKPNQNRNLDYLWKMHMKTDTFIWECEQCGYTEKKRNLVKSKNKRFCDKSCAASYSNKNRTGYRNKS